MNDTLTIFKEANIQSKEELLCSLKNLYEEFRTDDSILQSKKVLLMDFIRKSNRQNCQTATIGGFIPMISHALE